MKINCPCCNESNYIVHFFIGIKHDKWGSPWHCQQCGEFLFIEWKVENIYKYEELLKGDRKKTK